MPASVRAEGKASSPARSHCPLQRALSNHEDERPNGKQSEQDARKPKTFAGLARTSPVHSSASPCDPVTPGTASMTLRLNLSRRSFLKASAATAAGLAAFGVPAVNVLGANETINVGAIGIGGR